MNILNYVLVFVFGAMIGSFLNVVVLRLHQGIGFIKDRSKCWLCGHKLKWWENIPIISFIFLKARCLKCKNKISWQYIVVEAMTACLFVFVFFVWQSREADRLVYLLYWWLLASVLLLIFVYDYKYYIIPDSFILGGIIISLLFKIYIWWQGSLGFDFLGLINFLGGLFFSALIVSGFFALQYYISKGRAIGGGDVKLGILMGVVLGWPLSLFGLFFAYILGLCVCLPMLIMGKKKMQSRVPFGTFLTVSTIISLFYGNQIWEWYINLII